MSKRPVIMGELGLISLFDLAQLLLLNGASGTLHVTSQERHGWLRFERGQIVAARDEQDQDGLEAAYEVFTWRQGTFAFRTEPPTGGNGRRIQTSTEGLMMEAARRMDEASVGRADADATRALLERAGLWATLRQTTLAPVAEPVTAGLEGGDALLALEHGLVLVGAPGIRAAEALLRATVARLRAQRDATVQFTAERAAARQNDARGPLLTVPRSRFAASLTTTAPAVVALDCAHADLAGVAIAHDALVIVAVVAPDAASLLPSWVARHGLAEHTHDVGVLFDDGRSQTERRVTTLHVVVTADAADDGDLRAAA